MKIKIRKFKKKDAVKASNIIKQGWLSIISKEYPEKAVENQIKENSPKKIFEKSKQVHYYLAICNEKVLGIGGYNQEKVQAFFVKPGIRRKGIGSKIMARVLKRARREGIQSLDCWSTYGAERFYNSFGFKRKHKIKVENNNNPIFFILMTKKPIRIKKFHNRSTHPARQFRKIAVAIKAI